MEMFSWPITKDMLTLVLAFAGLAIAGLGLNTWNKQIKGSKGFETAYHLHLSALKMREAIKHVRNPFIWPSENQKAAKFVKDKYPEKAEAELHEFERGWVYEMRWQRIMDATSEIDANLLAAEVLWGSEIIELVRPLNRKVVELKIGLDQFFNPELRTQDSKTLHDLIYDKSHESALDPFEQDVQNVIEGIGDYLKKKIK